MPTKRNPRKSSLQFWPRKRASKPFARIRSWLHHAEAKPLGFAGYKVGMTHGLMMDNRKASPTKKSEITIPLTVIECPPIKVIGVTTYTKDIYGLHASSHVFADKLDKDLKRTMRVPKKQSKKIDDLKADELAEVRLIVATQPRLTTIGKKKPEVFELGIGGNSVDEKIEYAKGVLGKEINISDVFAEGNQIDTHAITTGRGNQGPVKRHGIKIRRHKSEKTKRGPGSLGPWHGLLNWTVAHAGQTGYHQRMEFNKWLVKMSDKVDEINPSGGWIRYGLVKNQYILLKGSVTGPSKRLIKFTLPQRPNHRVANEAPELTWISLETKQ